MQNVRKRNAGYGDRKALASLRIEEEVMMTKTASTGYTNMSSHTAKAYRPAKKSLKKRFSDYMQEVFEFYGKLYEQNGYRPLKLF